jgi:hypothetical protein
VSSQHVALKEVGFVSEAGVGAFNAETAKDAMIKRAIAEMTIATGLLEIFILGRGAW